MQKADTHEKKRTLMRNNKLTINTTLKKRGSNIDIEEKILKVVQRDCKTSDPLALRIKKCSEHTDFEDIFRVKVIRKECNNSYNATPKLARPYEIIKTEPNDNSPSTFTDNSSVFYPYEPKLTNVNARKTPGELILNIMNDKAKIFTNRNISFSDKIQLLKKERKFTPVNIKDISEMILFKEKRARYRGKIHKGLCISPSKTPNPLALHNIKISY